MSNENNNGSRFSVQGSAVLRLTNKRLASKNELPAASRGVSKARQQHEDHLEASFGVWTRWTIDIKH